LMLGESAKAGLGLTEGTLEMCLRTISTSMEGTEQTSGITKSDSR
jgi:hypothetical protein